MSRPNHQRGLSYAAGWTLWATGVSAAASRVLTRRGRFALLLHRVYPPLPENYNAPSHSQLTVADLKDLLGWLRRRFVFLTPAEYFAEDKPGVLLTFDDGFANNCRHALPVLRMFECPAIFFVSTQHVAMPRDWLGFVKEEVIRFWGSMENVPENVAQDWYDGMSIKEVQQCAADPLVSIGSHGVTHAILTDCDDEHLTRELRESKSFLERITERPVEYFAYPRGKYDRRVLVETEAAGYRAAFVIDSLGLGAHRFEIPRVGIYRADSSYLSLKLSGLHRRPLPVHR